MSPETTMKTTVACTLTCILSAALPAAQAAEDLFDKTIVYIECGPPNSGPDKMSRGTGVLVSNKGHILTAKHVVHDGDVCFGAIGNASLPKQRLNGGKKSSQYDARLLQIPSAREDFPFLKFCWLDNEMRREAIVATGFPGHTETGLPSSRVGVLSTVFPNGDTGIIETDTETARGMSGGAVTLAGSNGLIGIIAGVKTDPGTGLVESYGVLAAQEIESELGLTPESRPCSRAARLASLREVRWNAGDGKRPLGVHRDEGYCYLSGIRGVFNNANDAARIEVDEASGEYVLTGSEDGGGQIEASARCALF